MNNTMRPKKFCRSHKQCTKLTKTQLMIFLKKKKKKSEMLDVESRRAIQTVTQQDQPSLLTLNFQHTLRMVQKQVQVCRKVVRSCSNSRKQQCSNGLALRSSWADLKIKVRLLLHDMREHLYQGRRWHAPRHSTPHADLIS